MFDGFPILDALFTKQSIEQLRREFERRFAPFLGSQWEDVFHVVLIEFNDYVMWHPRCVDTLEQTYVGFRWRAAYNIYRAMRRREKRQAAFVSEPADQIDGLEELIDHDHLKHNLREAIKTLNQREREVLQEVVERIDWLGEATYERVADTFQSTPEAIRSVWKRALKKLRLELERREVGYHASARPKPKPQPCNVDQP